MRELSIEKFRNLTDVNLTACGGLNVICGENGQGKTNILEAVWLFTGARSFTGAKESELIPFNDSVVASSVSFFGGGRENTAYYSLGSRRKTELNQVKQKGISALAGSLLAVIFAPQHLSLVKGSPIERRRALDLVICQLKPRYIALLSQYSRLLTQRNALLKECRVKPALLETLEDWDKALASSGALISKTRESYAAKLIPHAQGVYSGISGNREELGLHYSSWAPNGQHEASVLLSVLQESRTRDLQTGITNAGPHRDDLGIFLDGREAKSFASQGQQRSAVLALKIGECDLMEQLTGERPIILLDDVMSELDSSRRDFLLHRFGDRQIFLTCCDPNQIAGAGTVFKIANGRVVY